jgi:galactoside O-acetyltransferase
MSLTTWSPGPITVGDHDTVGVVVVVTRDVEPYTIVAGNPAELISRIQH